MAGIVQSDDPIALVGGGAVRAEDLNWVRTYAKMLVAADGGANKAMDFGWPPEVVIGDFDSIRPDIQQTLGKNRLFRISEQDSTDFDKCLRNITAPLVLGIGLTGQRLDHTLSVLTNLAIRADRKCLLMSEEEVIFLAPPRLELPLPEGTALSLYPLGPVTGQSAGLFWPIDGIPMAPDGRVGTSNRVDGAGHVTLTVPSPKMLVFVPRAHADAAVSALLDAPAWPAS